MQLRDIGEFGLIRKLFNIFSSTGEDQANLFPFDDCAVLDIGDYYLLITTDLINQQTHIPDGATGYQVGWFLTAINLSDLASKGATPLGFLNSMALPPELDVEFVESIADGMAACGRAYSCPIIGGDTKSSSDLTISGVAFGTVLKQRFMPRMGSRSGDIIAVTGDLGRVGYAFHKIDQLAPSKDNNYYKELFLRLVLEVKPRLLAGQMLAKLGCVHSSIDLSDGIGSALHQLQELNQVGYNIRLDTLPAVPMLQEIMSSISESELEDILLYTGGDYELLVTLEPSKFKTAHTALQLLGVPLTAIGKVTSEPQLVLHGPLGKRPLQNKGFDHFNP